MIGSLHLRHRLQVDRLGDSDTIFGDLTIRDQPCCHGGSDFQVAQALLRPNPRTLGAPTDCSITTFRPSRRFIADPTTSSLLSHGIFHGIFMVI